MTREEAVARIKDHIEIHRYHERNAVKIFEALDMAIKALKQPEPCEDAVSREAVQDTIHKWCGDCVDCETIAYEVITKIPPVTPKQRTGKWIKKHRHYGGFRSYTGFDAMGEQHTVTVDERTEYDDLYCPECGARSADNFLNFCPNCGLKMEVTE